MKKDKTKEYSSERTFRLLSEIIFKLEMEMYCSEAVLLHVSYTYYWLLLILPTKSKQFTY